MEIDAKSPHGNAWYIISAVRKLLIDVGRGDEANKVSGRMRSGNYENLCNIAEEVTNGSITIVNRNGEDN